MTASIISPGDRFRSKTARKWYSAQKVEPMPGEKIQITTKSGATVILPRWHEVEIQIAAT